MNAIYFPIFKALTAEFAALENIKPHDANRIVPIFELPIVPDRKKYRESSTPITDFIDDAGEKIGQLRSDKYAMFDAYQWNPAATNEHGEHIIAYMHNILKSNGVKAIPIVGYDRWDVLEYKLALQSITRSHRENVCIRLDQTAFEDSSEPDFFQGNLNEILSVLDLDPAKCHIVLDFGDVTPFGAIDLLVKFESLLNLISDYFFKSYSVAGCSLPKTINEAVKTPNTCGVILRKEMLLWQSLRHRFPNLPICFGDYGVRGPNTNEGVRNRHTNGKIRYTIEKEYYIARGQSLSKPPKGEQMWELAQQIMSSSYYLGPNFSWGDSEILRCANKEIKGNAWQWIAIDTSHHLAFVVGEIIEFEKDSAARAVAL